LERISIILSIVPYLAHFNLNIKHPNGVLKMNMKNENTEQNRPLHCSNLPISIERGEIRFAGEVMSTSRLLDRVQQELNSLIDKMRENGSPLAEVTDLVFLTDIMLEKEFDRPDDIVVYLLAREGCTFNSMIFDDLRSIVLGIARNELTEEHLFRAFLRAVFPRDWLSTVKLDGGESSGVRQEETSPGGTSPELISHSSAISDGAVQDRHRPIVIDGENAGIWRIDTGALRKVQQKLNVFIDRICSSKSTGNHVVETYVFLDHLLEAEFYARGNDCITSPEKVDLLEAAIVAKAKDDTVVVELTWIAECIAAGVLSVNDLIELRRSKIKDRQRDTSATTD
jgi:hypothetical protein